MKQLSYLLIVKLLIISVLAVSAWSCSESEQSTNDASKAATEIDDLNEKVKTASSQAEKVIWREKRAEYYEEVEAFDLALIDYQYLTTHGGGEDVAYYLNEIGNCYYGMDSLEKALESYLEAIKIDDSDAIIILNAGSVFAELDEHEQAIEYLTRAFDMGEQDSVGLVLRAASFDMTDQFDKSVKDYKQHIDLFGQTLFCLHGIALCYESMEVLDSAEHYYQLSVDFTDGTDAMVLTDRGTFYLFSDQFEKAQQDFLKLLEMDESDVNALYYMGLLYSATEAYDNALKYFNKTIEIEPEHREAYLERGIIKNDQGKEGACEDILKAQELGAEIPEDLQINCD